MPFFSFFFEKMFFVISKRANSAFQYPRLCGCALRVVECHER